MVTKGQREKHINQRKQTKDNNMYSIRTQLWTHVFWEDS